MVMNPKHKVEDYRWNYTLSALVNHKFSARHSNRTGIIYNWLWYDTRIRNTDEYGNPLVTYADGNGRAGLLQFYSRSRISVTNQLIVNAGLDAQYFFLSGRYSVEPRIGARWNFLPRHTVTLAYGLHSQIDKIQLYLVEQQTPQGTVTPNRHLGLNKAHHLVAGYELAVREDLVFRAEP